MNLMGKHLHFVGIGGISLSGLAKISLKLGAKVSGSDISCSYETQLLETLGVKIFYQHEADNVNGADVVVFSSAISIDNPELLRAQELKIKILKRAEFLAIIAKMFKVVIAIAGSHGKTTTTAMIASLLIDAKLNPTVHLGGEFPKIHGNINLGDEEFFITEACEYKDNFLYLKPNISICLNVDVDHLDYFKTFSNIQSSFKKFINKNKNGTIIVNYDDSFLRQNKSSYNYSINTASMVRAINIKEYLPGKFAFDCLFDEGLIEGFKLNVYGFHNIYNALATIIVGRVLNIKSRVIVNSVNSFSGVTRRFEEKGKINGCPIIIDYAHHPKEINASIESAKKISNKVVAIFQPHTYSRTQALADDFASVLGQADEVAIYKIYPAREVELSGVNANFLSQKVNEISNDKCKNHSKSSSIETEQELMDYIVTKASPESVILLLGAGDIVDVCDRLPFDQIVKL